MGKIIKDTIHANGIDIGIYTQDFENEFISLTDIARYKSDDPTAVIQNWMRNRDVIEFLGLWERLHNPDFTPPRIRGGGVKSRLEPMRLQCLVLCPFGWVQDLCYKIPFFKKFNRFRGDKILRYLKYLILLVFVSAVEIVSIIVRKARLILDFGRRSVEAKNIIL